jgi:hypothetical protein
MGSFIYPSIADFKAYFFRDFPYGDDIETNVTDQDIAKAMGQANVNFNPALFGDQNSFSIAYDLLSAHYLVVDLRMSSQGINGQYSFLEQSKSVGSVSQSFAIPQRILDDPYFSMLSKTNYGAKYLELIIPQLAGQMFLVHGSTRP